MSNSTPNIQPRNPSEQPPRRKKMSPVKRKHMKINRRLIVIMLIVCLLTIVAFAINIYRISKSSTGAGASTSLSSNTDRSMKNDLYEIGNNPTAAEKTYFQQLTDAINANDDAAISEAVAKNFVADYFTWTNKDGNYEVGGLQYIYGPKYSSFEEWSRYNYYSDLALYISQQGRDKLIQVKEITTSKDTEKAPDFTVTSFDEDNNKVTNTYASYEVDLTWTYESNGADTAKFPTAARFFLVKNENRWEIAEFYDAESIREWEEQNADATAKTQQEG